MEQISFLDEFYDKYTIQKPIRLIELFSGYGSQALSLDHLGVDYESWRICEWNAYSSIVYKKLHCKDDIDYSKTLTKDEIVYNLHRLGVSLDWNQPATIKQLSNKKEQFLRDTYNSIFATHNLVDISKAKGVDFAMENRDDYCVIMTYSFPCQDLSLAGIGKGMERDSNTRSSLLWQVERIILELKELNQLPDILLMENVPQVIGEKNIHNYKKWENVLSSLGYESYTKVLNASDYEIPQHRERCFMVSIKTENSYYTFPKPIKLETTLNDFLEENVDEKYFLSKEKIEIMKRWNSQEKPLENVERDRVVWALTTHCGKDSGGIKLVKQQINVIGNYSKSNHSASRIVDPSGIAPTVMENHGTINAIPIKTANKLGFMYAEEGDGVDISTRMEYHRGTVQKGKTQTITTMGGENNGVVFAKEKLLKEKLCDELLEKGLVKEGDIINHSYSNSRMEKPVVANSDNPNCSATLTTRPDTLGVVVNKPLLVGGIGEKDSNNGKQYKNQNRVYSSETSSSAIATGFLPNYETTLGIRKLTPREYFRLMGLYDSEIDKIINLFSNAILYHLAGDSIVVQVLENIFKQML